MQIEILKKTDFEGRELKKGDVLNLPRVKAQPLIDSGNAKLKLIPNGADHQVIEPEPEEEQKEETPKKQKKSKSFFGFGDSE